MLFLLNFLQPILCNCFDVKILLMREYKKNEWESTVQTLLYTLINLGAVRIDFAGNTGNSIQMSLIRACHILSVNKVSITRN